jgi:dihydrolipoamide dehydrogenase
MKKHIVVIGAGPGGYVAALRAAALGAEVCLIEKESVGGTCLNWGCIPSKIMKTTADLFLKLKASASYGIEVGGEPCVDMEALMQRKRTLIDLQQKGIHALLKKGGVTYKQGCARIAAQGRVSVRNPDAAEEQIPYDALILATGTAPLNVPGLEFDGDTILSSNHLLELTSVPESILIVGGGVIGCEFAFILSALGAKVTVVEALDRILPLNAVDASCSKIIAREMKKRKIALFTERTVSAADKTDTGLAVTIGASPFSGAEKAAKGKESVVAVQKMAVCIGRLPLSKDLGLEAIGIDLDDRGWIKVNERMETSVDNVYAVGDILGPQHVMLAHVATHEGLVAAENAMGQEAAMEYTAVPGAIFTMPEVGNVGLSEADAVAKGLEVTATSVHFRTLGKSQVIGEIAGEAKIVAETGTGRLLGVHITGPHATDLIAEGTLALRNGLSIGDVAHTIHAHPTLAEIMAEVALKGSGRALHG